MDTKKSSAKVSTEPLKSTKESVPVNQQVMPAPRKTSFISTFLIVLLSLALGGFGMYAFLNRANIFSTISFQPRVTPTQESEMNTYTDKEAGFSFQYPKTLLLNAESKGAAHMVLYAGAEPIEDIKEQPFMSREIALEEKDALAKGILPNTASWSIEKNVVPLGKVYGAVSTLLSQFEVCSVNFGRSVRFYNGNFMVTISLIGVEEDIIAELPAFFQKDATKCDTLFMWKEDGRGAFLDEVKKSGNTAGHEWYQTFDAIVKSITVSPIQTVTTPVRVTNTVSIAKPTTQIACDVSDSGLCNVITDIKQGIANKNWDTILAYETQSSITCDPDGMVTTICEGQPKGTVKTGYMIGYIQSEGSMVVRSDYLVQMKNYATTNGPFVYKGTVHEGNKAIIVFLNTSQTKALLFPLLKNEMTWRGTMTLVGNATEEYKTLSPAILEMM